MPETGESGYTRSGRLFAALAVLHLLVSSDRTLPGPDDFKEKDSVSDRINVMKRDFSYDELTSVRKKGGQAWKLASEIFRSVPGFLDPGALPTNTFSPAQLAEHRAGYDAQLAEYRKDFADLLP
ncbi:hypothetical protein ACGFYV_16930 [Streptomyces sp. NPDC048297]|uniref:hypothetical protein n=1 Tax=Streptomyces sp. NPDC048297 TaxID=3365531 RepID=UPI0037154FE1